MLSISMFWSLVQVFGSGAGRGTRKILALPRNRPVLLRPGQQLSGKVSWQQSSSVKMKIICSKMNSQRSLSTETCKFRYHKGPEGHLAQPAHFLLQTSPSEKPSSSPTWMQILALPIDQIRYDYQVFSVSIVSLGNITALVCSLAITQTSHPSRSTPGKLQVFSNGYFACRTNFLQESLICYSFFYLTNPYLVFFFFFFLEPISLLCKNIQNSSC